MLNVKLDQISGDLLNLQETIRTLKQVEPEFKEIVINELPLENVEAVSVNKVAKKY